VPFATSVITVDLDQWVHDVVDDEGDGLKLREKVRDGCLSNSAHSAEWSVPDSIVGEQLGYRLGIVVGWASSPTTIIEIDIVGLQCGDDLAVFDYRQPLFQ
jgi:hypothetical protein